MRQALIKSSNRIQDSLLPNDEPKLAIPLLLLIAQHRSLVVINADAPYIKMVTEQFDKCHGILLQYVDFLSSAARPASAYARLVPLLNELVHTYHLETKVWDMRQRSCSHEFNPHEDYISDMTFASDSMKLVATSGDGTLSVCNLRLNKVQSQSEFSEDELLSVVIMKNGRKVICGSQSGTLLLYSWGFFKDCNDRFVDLSPNTVDTLLKLDEDKVITGCDNGILSLVGILPNQIIQLIGPHKFPIEALALSHDKKFLGSTAHDSMLKLWDLEEILEGKASGAVGDKFKSTSRVIEDDKEKQAS